MSDLINDLSLLGERIDELCARLAAVEKERDGWKAAVNVMWDKTRKVEKERDQAREELTDIREILAGTDIGSLPNDYSTARMVEDRIRTIGKLQASAENLRAAKDTFFRNGEAWEARANTAEAQLASARQALEEVLPIAERHLKLLELPSDWAKISAAKTILSSPPAELRSGLDPATVEACAPFEDDRVRKASKDIAETIRGLAKEETGE